jgi:hypothetical protein
MNILTKRDPEDALSAKLNELKEELRRRWHQPVAEVGKWLKSVVQGGVGSTDVPAATKAYSDARKLPDLAPVQT